MHISKRSKTFIVGSTSFSLKRQESGLVEIVAETPSDAQTALGFVHAHERLMQMLFSRAVAQGRITEYFLDTEEAFSYDLLIRKLGLMEEVKSDLENLTQKARLQLENYTNGVNAYIDRYGFPFLSKISKVRFEKWQVSDTLLLIKMMMYLGLAQQQERIERFIIHAIHDKVPAEKLKHLFSPHLDQLDEETVFLIRSLKLELPFLGPKIHFHSALSNNWAVSKEKSLSGNPLLCFDPHLHMNRLPAIWYEVVVQTKDNFFAGITLPGYGGCLMGRTKYLGASITYGMMDTIDFFIERIQEGGYLRENSFLPLHQREEVFNRKKKGAVSHCFYETDLGVLETKGKAIDDGLYLSFAWSAQKNGVAPIVNSIAEVWETQTVQVAQGFLKNITMPCNWAIADSSGNIGFQQSGRLPNRKNSGLFPLAAWRKENHWQGFVSAEDLHSEYNPQRGFVVSANDDKNQQGKPVGITVPYGNYRYRRIVSMLSQDKKFSIEDMKALQTDLYSIQAQELMAILRPHIPETDVGKILKDWNFEYTKDSQGATLFEACYFHLLLEAFGPLFGKETWELILRNTSLLVFTHALFDRILLSDDESWYGKEGKAPFFQRVLNETLQRFKHVSIPTWGKLNCLKIFNLFVGGKFPKICGFDAGPFEMDGNRATVAALLFFPAKKRPSAASAVYRFITDMGLEEIYTVLAGGPSENSRSRYYKNELALWLSKQYKHVQLSKENGNGSRT